MSRDRSQWKEQEIRAGSMRLRPEVKTFAEEIESLLRENDAEKGDDWKRAKREAGIADLDVSVARFKRSMHGGDNAAKRAASVGAHAMFVAISTGSLEVR